jgi:hypothetical protein
MSTFNFTAINGGNPKLSSSAIPEPQVKGIHYKALLLRDCQTVKLGSGPEGMASPLVDRVKEKR